MLRLRLRSFSSRAYTVVLLVCSCFLSPDSTHARGEDASGNPQEGIASGGDRRKKIAVIGAGISGTFVTKYLAEYDEKCLIDSIVLFDPRNDESGLQGGRVRSLRRDDGSVVELGASIIYSGNILAKEVVDADPNLVDVPPHSSGLHKDGSDTTADKLNMAKGFGIWDGKEFTLLTSTTADFLMKFKYLYRYNFDLIRLSRAVSKAANSFSLIYKLLDSNKPSTYFSSADEIWNVCGLLDASRMSFDNLLDSLGVAQNIAYWRSFLPWQRSLRKELVIGANLSNYNQNNAELNGLAGLVSFLPTRGQLFAVKGGNDQIPLAALEQGQNHHSTRCGPGKITHKRYRVTSVIASRETMDIFAGDKLLGKFDLVILAAPLQHCQIDFLMRTHMMDDAELSQMPLGNMSSNPETRHNVSVEQYSKLPSSTKGVYKQTVTTIVRNASLQTDHFHVKHEELPRSVYFTNEGKAIERISSISQVNKDGTFKMFSSQLLTEEMLRPIFGKDCKIEHVKVWGGQYGGAYPSFDGGGEKSVSAPFLLYERSEGSGPALYFTNGMEASVAAIEISAIGAKAVAKLISERLRLMSPKDDSCKLTEL